MPQAKLIDRQMARLILPITMNQDGSVNVTLSFGVVEQHNSPEGVSISTFVAKAQNHVYLSADEARPALEATANAGETLSDLLDRALGEVLSAKGVI